MGFVVLKFLERALPDAVHVKYLAPNDIEYP